MRCRSDPVKIEALTTRSWEPSVTRNEEEDEEFVDCENQIENVQQDEANHDQDNGNVQQDGANQDQQLDNVQKDEVGQDQELDNVQEYEVGQDQELDNVQKDEVGQDQEHDNVQEHEVGQDQEHDNVQEYEVGQDQEQDNEQQYEVQDQQLDNEQKDEVVQDQELDNEQKDEVGKDQDQEQREVEEESFNLVLLFEEIMNQDYELQEQDEAHEEDDVAAIGATMVTELAEISETHEKETVNEAEVLPECLLMMIHEPKLSINVSKETWVCRTDFIKRPSNRKPPPPPIKTDGGVPTVLQQPARSSCSLPMATVLEQKLANAVGYEPFVLTRCKSEPMKTAASKLLPESCVWENRKLERLSRAAFGVGAAGLGF
ncbi:hypothetical protein L1987_49534 [Smallanthus sonchifolius]|uniref:Uncharacterized protein n=1 Tax=Smallanthus sonchifolius TaxID=185202 RepID=A0ACB9FUD3_9ASTR|nr:hypothetical protein L1987_49534 [Smallanthus sonchifolius]